MGHSRLWIDCIRAFRVACHQIGSEPVRVPESPPDASAFELVARMNSLSSAPAITVGLPVYNGQAYLRDALDSILAQTFEDFELIVSDNASTDETGAILADYAERDSRVRVVTQSVNGGAAANYNTLVDLARGRYFKWAAHDDVLGETFLERCIVLLEKSADTTVIAFPRTHWIRSDGTSIGDYTDPLPWTPGGSPSQRLRDLLADQKYSYLLKCSPIFGLIRTDALRKTRCIQSFMSSDRVSLIELALLGDWVEVPEFLFRRRLHEQTSLAQSKNEAEVAQWFDPKAGSKFPMPRVTLFRAYLRAVRTMPMTSGERLRCLRVLAGLFRREWRVLGGEYKIKLSELLGFRPRGSSGKRAWAERAPDLTRGDETPP